jgi:hypothetical protein
MKLPHGYFGDVLLVDGGGPIGWAIKRRTMSDWSHVARFVDVKFVNRLMERRPEVFPRFVKLDMYKPLDDGAIVVEALPGGVMIRDAGVYRNAAWRVRTFVDPLSEEDRERGEDWLMDQVGHGYDWRGVLLGHVLQNEWIHNRAGWFCSELSAAWDMVMLRGVISDTASSLIPPHFYAVTSGLKTTDWHVRKPDGWQAGRPETGDRRPETADMGGVR